MPALPVVTIDSFPVLMSREVLRRAYPSNWSGTHLDIIQNRDISPYERFDVLTYHSTLPDALQHRIVLDNMESAFLHCSSPWILHPGIEGFKKFQAGNLSYDAMYAANGQLYDPIDQISQSGITPALYAGRTIKSATNPWFGISTCCAIWNVAQLSWKLLGNIDFVPDDHIVYDQALACLKQILEK